MDISPNLSRRGSSVTQVLGGSATRCSRYARSPPYARPRLAPSATLTAKPVNATSHSRESPLKLGSMNRIFTTPYAPNAKAAHAAG
jgi:hypothetical protein